MLQSSQFVSNITAYKGSSVRALYIVGRPRPCLSRCTPGSRRLHSRYIADGR